MWKVSLRTTHYTSGPDHLLTGDYTPVRTESKSAMSTTSIEHRVATKTRHAVPQRQLLKTGVTAAFAGVVVVEAYAALLRAAGVPMRAGFLAAAHAQPVTQAASPLACS